MKTAILKVKGNIFIKALFSAVDFVLKDASLNFNGKVVELTEKGLHFGHLMDGTYRYEYAGTIILDDDKMINLIVSTDSRESRNCLKGWACSFVEIPHDKQLSRDNKKLEMIIVETEKILPLFVSKMVLGQKFQEIAEQVVSFQEQFAGGVVMETADWILPEEMFFNFISGINMHRKRIGYEFAQSFSARIGSGAPFSFSADFACGKKSVRVSSSGGKILIKKLYKDTGFDHEADIATKIIDVAVDYAKEQAVASPEEPSRPSDGCYLRGREIVPFMRRLFDVLSQKRDGIRVGGEADIFSFIDMPLFDIPPYNNEVRWVYASICRYNHEYWWKPRCYSGLEAETHELFYSVYRQFIAEAD